jgi:hypothetical protein
MKTIINDIAMRPAITSVAKIVWDSKFEAAVNQYLGKEWLAEIKQWVKEAAGQRTYRTPAQSAAARAVGFLFDNIVSDFIGGSLGTIEKHTPTAMVFSMKEVGMNKFINQLLRMNSFNPEFGEREWKFARYGGVVDGNEWGGSTELQRRIRAGYDTLTGTQRDLFDKFTVGGRYMKWREVIQAFGAKGVALGDLLSAVPTWLVSYKDAIARGETHGDAVFLADRAVRRAHGSTSVAAKPMIMRYKAAGYMVPFYNFFSTALNRQYEIAWKAKMLLEFRRNNGEEIPTIDQGLLKVGSRRTRLDLLRYENEYNGGLTGLRDVTGGIFAYIIAPAIFEQLASPIYGDEDDTATIIAKSLLFSTSASWPILRDVVSAFTGGREPSIGVYSEGAKSFSRVWRDMKEFSADGFTMDSAHAAKYVRDFNFVFAMATGLSNDTIGKLAEYLIKVSAGDEEPTGPGHIYRGIRYGTGEPRPGVPYWME